MNCMYHCDAMVCQRRTLYACCGKLDAPCKSARVSTQTYMTVILTVVLLATCSPAIAPSSAAAIAAAGAPAIAAARAAAAVDLQRHCQ
jgi:hypothetical protein